ncbi:MAG TPA: TlpA disulfide reductase family protein, partial [Candidatus Eisenbacteria bacterium]|nr:TlpA disulfide reductase family protein [Candidatus Eisenbacteria bacterium]
HALAHVELTGVMHFGAAANTLHQGLDAPVFIAVRAPLRLRWEVGGATVPRFTVADGESLWVGLPRLGQYTARRLVPPGATAADSAAAMAMLDPFGEFARAGAMRDVRELGRDTVRLDDRVAGCVRIAYSTPGDSLAHVVAADRVLWVEPATHLVLRDSTTSIQFTPQYGPVTSIQTTRYTRVRTDLEPPDSLFAFHAPADLRRVRRFEAGPRSPLEGQPAPDFTLAGLDGRPVHLAALRGQVVLLDFWATWCGPCRGWLPIVARAHRVLASHGLHVFAVNLKEPEDRVRAYLRQANLDLPVLMDTDAAVGRVYGATGIPMTVIIGRDGRVARVLVGLHEDDDLRDALADAGMP